MSYFLKVQSKQGRTYIAIVESYYNPDKKCGAHRIYKSLGSVETLMKKGIKDPVAYYKKEAEALNLEAEKNKVPRISDTSPVLNVGYFPFKLLMNGLNIKEYIDLFKYNTDFDFDLYKVLSACIYTRILNPYKTTECFFKKIQSLYGEYGFTPGQIYDAIGYMGVQYSKFAELFAKQTQSVLKQDTDITYICHMDFYLGTYGEDMPFVRLGLLFDKDMIPLNIKFFQITKDNKPGLEEITEKLKKPLNIKGRTIYVTDAKPGCDNDIPDCISEKNGYVFPKDIQDLPDVCKMITSDGKTLRYAEETGHKKFSCKVNAGEFSYYTAGSYGKKREIKFSGKRIIAHDTELERKEKAKIIGLTEDAINLINCRAERKDCKEAAKYIIFDKDVNNNEESAAALNADAVKSDLALAGWEALYTSETDISENEIYERYRSLSKIKELFKDDRLNSYAESEFIEDRNFLYGRLFILYAAVLLLKALEVKVLENKFTIREILAFTKGFTVTEYKNEYINNLTAGPLPEMLENTYNIPIKNKVLFKSQLDKLFDKKILPQGKKRTK